MRLDRWYAAQLDDDHTKLFGLDTGVNFSLGRVNQ